LDIEVLRKLRRRHMVIQNCGIILALIFIGVISLLAATTKTFYFLVGFLCLVLFILGNIGSSRTSLFERLFPSMKQLLKYERGKLGIEGQKLEKRSKYFSVVPIVMCFLLGVLAPEGSRPLELNPLFFLLLGLILLGIINVSSYLHTQRVDHSEPEKLQGYANSVLIYGIVGGIGVSILIIFIVALIAVS
jgi:MFS family permease